MIQREHYVILIMVVIAVLVMMFGFGSMTGLSIVEMDALDIDAAQDVVVFKPTIFLADTALEAYADGTFVSSVSLKDFLDKNNIDYSEKTKKGGTKTIYTDSALNIPFSEFRLVKSRVSEIKIKISGSDIEANAEIINQ